MATTVSPSSTRRSRSAGALERLVLDLAVEVVLAGQVAEPGQVPHDVVGEQGQDPLVVALPEALEVRRRSVLADADTILLLRWVHDRRAGAR